MSFETQKFYKWYHKKVAQNGCVCVCIEWVFSTAQRKTLCCARHRKLNNLGLNNSTSFTLQKVVAKTTTDQIYECRWRTQIRKWFHACDTEDVVLFPFLISSPNTVIPLAHRNITRHCLQANEIPLRKQLRKSRVGVACENFYFDFRFAWVRA